MSLNMRRSFSFRGIRCFTRKKHVKISIDRSGLGKPAEDFSNGDNGMSKEPVSPLASELINTIKLKGPITVHDYMALALNHSVHGYYQHKEEKIGKEGDFVTAPEISQLFGEMIAVWLVSAWVALGSPERIAIVELGPGKGTLMEDILRTLEKFKGLQKAATIHMVELSQKMRMDQHKVLGGAECSYIGDGGKFKSKNGIPLQWHSYLYQVPHDLPVLIIGQEFLDAFPVHQFVYTKNGWREKLIDIDRSASSSLHFRAVVSPIITPAVKSLVLTENERLKPIFSKGLLKDGVSIKEGDGLEISPLALATCEEIAMRVHGQSKPGNSSSCERGAALLIDYGENFTQEDSLRAFSHHRQTNVLSQVKFNYMDFCFHRR